MITDDLYGSQQYRWFTGIVKEIADNDRVKVRIFGIHKMDDTTDVSDGDLPLAMVVYPTNSSGGGHALAPGKWVVGYFADGDDCQQPVVTGVLKGGSGASDNSSSSSGATSQNAARSATDSGSPGTDSAGTANATASPSNLAGNTNAAKAYNFFYERLQASGKSGGSIHAQASALVGQGNSESGMNPKAKVMDINGWPSKGLTQWNRERLWKLERQYGDASSQQDKNLTPLNSTLEQQLAFWWDEMNGPEIRAFNKLLSAANATDATDAIVMFGRGKPSWGKGPDGKFGVQRDNAQYKTKLKATMDAMAQLKYTPRS